MTNPASKLCSQCGHTLQPQQISPNTYIFGHNCPTVIERLNDEAERIKSGSDYKDQTGVRRVLEGLQYQNIWTS